MSADKGPQDPITDLAEAAASMHELFLAYMAAGFTEYQALRLAAFIALGHPSPPEDTP